MKSHFTAMLEAHGYLPIEPGGQWNFHDLVHPAPADATARMVAENALAKRLSRIGGLYAFRDASGTVLYIGEADDLRERLPHLCRQLHTPGKSNGEVPFHSRFIGRSGPLRVYWMALDDYTTRRAVEVALQFATDEDWNLRRKRKFK